MQKCLSPCLPPSYIFYKYVVRLADISENTHTFLFPILKRTLQ